MKHLLAILILVAGIARGETLPPGDVPTNRAIPGGQSITLTGAGAGRTGNDPLRGTQLVPATADQAAIITIGDGPTNVGLGSSLEGFSVWGKASSGSSTARAKDGIVVRQWGGLRLESLGFNFLERGLVLQPSDELRRCVGLEVDSCWFANCETGIVVDLSKSKTRCCNRIRAPYITTGVGVGIEVIDPGPKGIEIEDAYIEAQDTAGIVVYSGTVTVDGAYIEQRPADINGDGKKDLIPGIAVVGGKVVLRNAEYVNYLYVSPVATFEADAVSSANIKYIVVSESDTRLAEWARLWRPRPGELARVLATPVPWQRGLCLQWRNSN